MFKQTESQNPNNMHSYKSEHQIPHSTAWNTLEIAHKLKCAIYSSFVIPPFPTSSMSGSVQSQADKMPINFLEKSGLKSFKKKLCSVT